MPLSGSSSLESDAAVIRREARPLSDEAINGQGLDELLHAIQEDQPLVLIGEASHGTHEFYALRAALTRRLIEERGFSIVAVEADWPDAFRAHRYVTGRGGDQSAAEALEDFRRFPAWMWRNAVVSEFLDWLKKYNQSSRSEGGGGAPAGFYGLDLYSMHTSMEAVLQYLEKTDPQAAQRARKRYACFEHFGEEPQDYGHATAVRGEEPCAGEVSAQLVELRRRRHELLSKDGPAAGEDFFSAEQNARLVINAERYYRSMFKGRDESWNLRDTHMFETLCQLIERRDGGGARAVVWAHNSHLGDARATEMGRRGELNLGQLVRERFGARACLIGQTTFTGTVTAARDWGGDAEYRRVRPALTGSYEALFHAAEIPAFWLDLREKTAAAELLRRGERLERAIGVIYRPETERFSHYFEANMARQFDLLIHLDETRALEPLERHAVRQHGELPETYPSAL